MDGVLNDGRLVRHLAQFRAEREILPNLRGERIEVFAEGEDVAAILHGDGDADGRCAVIHHFGIGRVDRAARDVRDVAKAEDSALCGDGEGTDVVEVVKDTRDAQVERPVRRLDRSAGKDGVLRAQGVRDRRRGDAEGGEAVAADLDVDAFALDADQLDFLHAWHGEDAAAHVLRDGTQLLIGVILACNGIDRAEYVVKAIVVEWTENAVRQVSLDVLAEVADVAPCRADEVRIYVVAQSDVDDGLTCARLACDLLESRRVLKTPLKFIRDLILHLLCRRARPCGGDNHLADGKGRILHAAEGRIGKDAADGKDDDKVPDKGAVAQGEFGEVSHFVRTASPSWRRWMPAVTTTASCGSPAATTSLSRNAVTVTGRRCTMPSSTTKTSAVSPV